MGQREVVAAATRVTQKGLSCEFTHFLLNSLRATVETALREGKVVAGRAEFCRVFFVRCETTERRIQNLIRNIDELTYRAAEMHHQAEQDEAPRIHGQGRRENRVRSFEGWGAAR